MKIERPIDPAFFAHSPAASQWEKIGVKDHHGVIVPLFSLYSKQSCGIGEYTDLFPMIEWCQSIGFDVIQLLPLNDTGWANSPYSAISAFALHPVYLGLASLPYLDQFPHLKEEIKKLQSPSDALHIDYVKVFEKKIEFLKLYVKGARHLIVESNPYKKFLDRSQYWLKSYVVFKVLKTLNEWKSWEDWPEEFRNPTPLLIDQLAEQHREEVEFHTIVQFLCDQQLHAVRTHAESHQVLIMGDLPILINRDSADVWCHRDLFDLSYSAGAPPDYFNEEGQNWGFPLYNWDNIAKADFSWWSNRLINAAFYYQLYRIDHIVGFFRIWAIPLGKTGKEGFFIPTNQADWVDHGRRIMWMMLENCEMLPIGEDLGVVPQEVRNCLTMLGISGTKVMRWERKWNEDKSFINISEYPLDSMTSVSTHDSEPLKQWWKLHPDEAGLYAASKGWQYQPELTLDQAKEIVKESHHSNSLFHVNLLQEYLGLVPGLSWPKVEDERINVPGTISPTNWSTRFKMGVEEIVSNEALRQVLKGFL